MLCSSPFPASPSYIESGQCKGKAEFRNLINYANNPLAKNERPLRRYSCWNHHYLYSEGWYSSPEELVPKDFVGILDRILLAKLTN